MLDDKKNSNLVFLVAFLLENLLFTKHIREKLEQNNRYKKTAFFLTEYKLICLFWRQFILQRAKRSFIIQ